MIGNIVAGTLSVGVPPVTSSYESIATVSLTSGSQSTITFSSIPSTYKHLQLRCLARDSSGDYSYFAQFNGDTASNYVYHQLFSENTSTPGASASLSQTYTYLGVAGTGTSIFSASVVDILDYQNSSKFKTIRTLHGFDANGSGRVRLISGLWQSTSAISSIVLSIPAGSGFAQYSHFALYGIKD